MKQKVKNYMEKTVPIDDIRPDPNQPRKTFDEESIKQLANTVKLQGVIEPIEIDENNVIVTGERRWRASKRAGLKKIRVKVVSGLTPNERLERQLVENIQREEIPQLEKIDSIKRLVNWLTSHPEEWKKSKFANKEKGAIAEAARRLGISRTWVSQVLGFERNAIPEVREAVKKGEMTVTAAIDISKAEKDVQKEALEGLKKRDKIEKKLIEDGFTKEQAQAMADVQAYVPKGLPKTGIEGTTGLGVRSCVIFYFDEKEDEKVVREFFRQERNKEPDSKKLLEMIKKWRDGR